MKRDQLYRRMGCNHAEQIRRIGIVAWQKSGGGAWWAAMWQLARRYDWILLNLRPNWLESCEGILAREAGYLDWLEAWRIGKANSATFWWRIGAEVLMEPGSVEAWESMSHTVGSCLMHLWDWHLSMVSDWILFFNLYNFLQSNSISQSGLAKLLSNF